MICKTTCVFGSNISKQREKLQTSTDGERLRLDLCSVRLEIPNENSALYDDPFHFDWIYW